VLARAKTQSPAPGVELEGDALAANALDTVSCRGAMAAATAKPPTLIERRSDSRLNGLIQIQAVPACVVKRGLSCARASGTRCVGLDPLRGSASGAYTFPFP